MAVQADIDMVRLLIADMAPDGDPRRLFTDDQLTQFLTFNTDAVRLAAADALDTIARSEVLVSKVIRTQDKSTDGAKVAAELRASAQQLREQHAADPGAEFDEFLIVPVNDLSPELVYRRPYGYYPTRVWGL